MGYHTKIENEQSDRRLIIEREIIKECGTEPALRAVRLGPAGSISGILANAISLLCFPPFEAEEPAKPSDVSRRLRALAVVLENLATLRPSQLVKEDLSESDTTEVAE